MKNQLLTLAIGILTFGAISANPAAKITFGTPIRKVFPATNEGPGSVYMEIPIKTTNTSKEAISFTTFISGPNFLEYVRKKRNSNHWTDISAKGMCGLSYSSMTLSPGESNNSTVLIDKSYTGKQFRLVLPVAKSSSKSNATIRVASPTITLP